LLDELSRSFALEEDPPPIMKPSIKKNAAATSTAQFDSARKEKQRKREREREGEIPKGKWLMTPLFGDGGAR